MAPPRPVERELLLDVVRALALYAFVIAALSIPRLLVAGDGGTSTGEKKHYFDPDQAGVVFYTK